MAGDQTGHTGAITRWQSTNGRNNRRLHYASINATSATHITLRAIENMSRQLQEVAVRFLINSCPALMDWLAFLISFAVLYRAGQEHLTLNQCAWLAGISSLTYMLTSFGIGLSLSRRNASRLMLISIIFTVLSIVLCLFTGQFKIMLGGMGMLGISTAIFFNSFQAFMRGESPPGSLMKTVGLYTFSWSLGAGMGLISSGFFYNFGVGALAIISVVIGFIIIIPVLIHQPRSLTALSSEEHVEQGPPDARPVNARYVWVGWIIMFTAMFVQRPLTGFYPSLSAADGVSPFMASLPLFLNYAVQALAGGAMIGWRRLLYRRLPLVITHVLAAILYLVVWQWPTLVVCLPAFGMLGVYFGFAYFASVYYSCNSGNRALNVGINECLVGMAALAGLFVSEWWMKFIGNTGSMYALCGLILILSIIFQLLLLVPCAKPETLCRASNQ